MAGGREGTVVFVPLAAVDLAALSDALAWHAKRLCQLRDGGKKVPGLIVTESEGYRERAEKVEELLGKMGEWWKLLGEA